MCLENNLHVIVAETRIHTFDLKRGNLRHNIEVTIPPWTNRRLPHKELVLREFSTEVSQLAVYRIQLLAAGEREPLLQPLEEFL